MSKLVPRWWAENFNMHGMQLRGDDVGAFVTDADAAKLERVVEAARKMRAHVPCSINSLDGIVMEDAPYKDCACGTCTDTRTFDVFLAELGENRG